MKHLKTVLIIKTNKPGGAVVGITKWKYMHNVVIINVYLYTTKILQKFKGYQELFYQILFLL